MKITGMFVLITIAVILSSSTTTEAGMTRNQCKTDNDCAPWYACISGWCDNPCEFATQGERATCGVVNHRAEFICDIGYEFPKDSNIELCLPVEWECHGHGKNPDVIDCNSPSWICLKSGGTTSCGNKEKILEIAIKNISYKK